MSSVGMVVSSEGRNVDVLVNSEKVEIGSIIRIENFFGIVAYMLYREDEKIGSKQELIAKTQIFGVLESDKIRKIKRPIHPYRDAFLATREELEKILSTDDKRISIGNVYGTDARAFMDPYEYERHMAILASTGSGKSYTAANLIKEFASLGLPVIVVDTHGEYSKLVGKLAEDSAISVEVQTVKYPRQGYKELKIPVSDLSPQDYGHFVILTEPQESALAAIIGRLDRDYVLDDVIKGCEDLDEKVFHEGTIRALKRKLMGLEKRFKNVFDKYGTDIRELVKPGQVTIIDVSFASAGVRRAVVSYLSKELLEGRIRKVNESENAIDNRLLLVVEEAHNYAAGNLSHSCKYQLQRVASEGRKFGIGLCVISQKPSKIDEEILSQCNTGIYMHITNPNDKQHIKKSFESISDEIISDLDSLDVGECIIAGAMIRIPFALCKVDKIDIKKKKAFEFKTPKDVKLGKFDYV